MRPGNLQEVGGKGEGGHVNIEIQQSFTVVVSRVARGYIIKNGKKQCKHSFKGF